VIWPLRKKRVTVAQRRMNSIPTQVADDRVTEHDGRIDELERTFSKLKGAPPSHLDESRSKIAFLFVKWYFFFIIVILLGAPIYNMIAGHSDNLDVSKLLNQIATLLGTPLGFVVGYYFKEKNK